MTAAEALEEKLVVPNFVVVAVMDSSLVLFSWFWFYPLKEIHFPNFLSQALVTMRKEGP